LRRLERFQIAPPRNRRRRPFLKNDPTNFKITARGIRSEDFPQDFLQRISFILYESGGSDGARTVGRPVTRWEDDIRDFVEVYLDMDASSWMALAQDREEWKKLAAAFASYGME
jgi:hypothetical protein